MRKIIFIILSLVCANATFSQISITETDMPQAGRVNLVFVDTVTHPNIGNPSSSPQFWNFTSLLSQYPQVASYSPVTPYQVYAPAFPGTNMFTYGPSILFAGFYGGSPVNIDSWGYMFWRTDSTGFHIVGFRVDYGVGDTNILENPRELLMGTPASYDSVFNNTSRWVASFNKAPLDPDTNYISTVTKTLTCDAYGLLQTSFGTFNVLRVHEYLIKVDSVVALMGTIPLYSMELSRDTLNNYSFWAKSIGYPIAIVKADADYNIYRVEYLADTMPGYTVTGSVYKTDGVSPITTGKAELIAKTAMDELYGVPETVELDTGGHFQFSNIIGGGDFLVHATPDADAFPFNLPTYYGDSIYWQDAATLTVLGDTSIVINTRNDSLAYLLTGLGNISGSIWENLGGAKTMELSSGIKVILEQNPSGTVARHTYTNALGQYAFTDLPTSNYRIKVDIPAIWMDSTYYIYYSIGDTTIENLDFYYDSTYIYIFNTSSVNDWEEMESFDITVYPNPFSENTFLYLTNVSPGYNCEVVIRDITGRILHRINSISPLPVKIERPGSYSGILFYEVFIDNVRRATGKLIVY